MNKSAGGGVTGKPSAGAGEGQGGAGRTGEGRGVDLPPLLPVAAVGWLAADGERRGRRRREMGRRGGVVVGWGLRRRFLFFPHLILDLTPPLPVAVVG
ncbi:unnamed protein product [Linum trigynum]|uniref:Uncharacterized protein n=1 Tax=Linum trigynum TaxID=586398 RepID=A0AAV2DNL1_9ROSI